MDRYAIQPPFGENDDIHSKASAVDIREGLRLSTLVKVASYVPRRLGRGIRASLPQEAVPDLGRGWSPIVDVNPPWNTSDMPDRVARAADTAGLRS